MLSQQGAKINTQIGPEKPKNLLISVALIGMEALGIWLLFAQSLFAIITGDYANLVASLFLAGFLFFAGLWVSNICLGLYRLRTWSRTAAIVLQLLIGSIAAASFSGIYGSPVIGFGLLIPSAFCLLLLFTKSLRDGFSKS
jgi:hypothetical protein